MADAPLRAVSAAQSQFWVWDVATLAWIPGTQPGGGGGGGTVDQGTGGASAWLVTGTVGVSGSVAVTGAFWQATQPVSGTVTANPTRPASSSVASVSSSASSVTLAASNANRKGLTVFNESAVVLYLKLGATASATSYTVQLGPGAYYEIPEPCYTGVVDGIWPSVSGAARVTELT